MVIKRKAQEFWTFRAPPEGLEQDVNELLASKGDVKVLHMQTHVFDSGYTHVHLIVEKFVEDEGDEACCARCDEEDCEKRVGHYVDDNGMR